VEVVVVLVVTRLVAVTPRVARKVRLVLLTVLPVVMAVRGQVTVVRLLVAVVVQVWAWEEMVVLDELLSRA
jgi:hypothetical protein